MLTYRIKTLYEPTLNLLKDPLGVAGIITSLWGIWAIFGSEDIDIPYFPDNADLNQVKEAIDEARARRKAQGEVNPNYGSWEDKLGVIFYNLTNPNWAGPFDADAPGVTEAFRDFLEDLR